MCRGVCIDKPRHGGHPSPARLVHEHHLMTLLSMYVMVLRMSNAPRVLATPGGPRREHCARPRPAVARRLPTHMLHRLHLPVQVTESSQRVILRHP